MVNFQTSLNNFIIKVDHLDISKLKAVLVHLKNLSDIVNDEVVKNIKFNTLKTKLDNIDKKIPDATTLIHISQYDTGKQNLEKKIKDVDKKILIQVVE